MAKKELTLREIAVERIELREAIENNCKAFEQKTGIVVTNIELDLEHGYDVKITLDNPFARVVNRAL